MLPKFFINRPIFASVISIIMVIAGLIAVFTLPMEEYPSVTPPQVVVSATYPGANAQTIATTVAAPIEDAINGVENMIYMQSTSTSSGSMTLNVYFKIGTDPQLATVDVNNRLATAIPKLPSDVTRLGVTAMQKSSSILEVIAFYDPEHSMNIIDLNNYVKINVVDALKRVPGVGDAQIVGAKDYAMRVWLDPVKLQKYSLSVPEVISAISQQNSQYAIGKLGDNPNNFKNPYVFPIDPQGRLKTVKEFEDIVVRANSNGDVLKLKQLAKVELGSSNYNFIGKLNGQVMAPVLIFLQNGANALNTATAVSDKLKELSKGFPGKLTYKIPYDTTTFVKISVEEVFHTFIEAVVLVMLVMYLFLGNLRSSIIPMIAVPVCIIGTFAGFYAIGFSINLITLFGLILAIGLVVDDAIIVVENAERIMEEKPELSVKEAVEEAMEEIVAPVISIVLVLCSVFVPVSFMEGFVGVIQRQFALTLTISIVISGIVALTLTPALCSLFLKKEHKEPNFIVKGFNKIFDKSTDMFMFGVEKLLKHMGFGLMVFVGIIVACVFMFKMLPTGLVPPEDKGSILSVAMLPAGATLNRAENMATAMEKMYLKNKDTQYITELIGYDLTSSALKDNSASFFVTLVPWKDRPGKQNSTFAYANYFNKAMYMLPQGMVFNMNPPAIMGLSLTSGFEMFAQDLQGKTYPEIYKDMQVILQKASQRKELAQVRTTLDPNYPQYTSKLNLDKAKKMGLKISDIYSTLNSTIGSYYVNDFNLLGKTFKVYLSANGQYRATPENLSEIFVKTANGNMVPINSLLSLKRTLGPVLVDRFNGYSAAKIMGSPAPGYTSGDAIKAISEVFKETFPYDYSIGWTGTSYQEVNSSGKGNLAFVFGLIFVYLILAAQYERWIMPIGVLTAVPFSVFGALLFSLLRGMSNDIYFQIGLILLIGLGAKNAILIIEFAMYGVQSGKTPYEAAVEAAKLRYRPILMTSIAFILGVIPLAISTGAGASSRHSLSTGVIGGMLAATCIAIFFVPMFFCILENLTAMFSKKKKDNSLEDKKEN